MAKSVRKARRETEELRKSVSEMIKARQKAGKPVPSVARRRKGLKPKGKIAGARWEREQAKYYK